MTNIFKALKYTSLFALTTFTFFACDNEYSSIDSDVLGKDNFNFNNTVWEAPIISYNKKLSPVQVNNLNSSLLGFYNDPINDGVSNFGETTASFVTQLTPASSTAPDFGTAAEIDSVVLNIPYYSRITKQKTVDGITTNTYTISDSVFGDENKPIKLSIYQNNYFIKDLESDSNEAQKYYSDAFNDAAGSHFKTEDRDVNFDDHILELLYESNIQDGFLPNNEEVILVQGSGDSEVKTAFAPSLRLNLADTETQKIYWKNQILDKNGAAELSNANNFKKYFRGLYFKAEPINGAGQMILLNTNSTDATLTIFYHNDTDTEQEYKLNISTGNKINTFKNSSVTLNDGDVDWGDDKIYLKGAEGSMAIVDLFGGVPLDCDDETDGLECFLNTFRQRDEDGYILKNNEKVDEDGYITENGNFVLKRLINEAQLVIYEDENTIGDDLKESHKYDRIYAYDLKNNIPTADYILNDGTENGSDPKNSEIISLGQRLEDTDGFFKYKIRLTQHLNNILIRDSISNTQLGLVLSNNVNLTTNSEILGSAENDIPNAVPSSAILAPRGTVLHGNNSTDNAKKMKLQIFFTEPEN